MIHLAVVIAVLSVLLVLTQLLWQAKIVRGENARKTFHILSGVFVAFLPWYLSWGELQILGLFLTVGVLVIRVFKLFPSLYQIKRRSWGEMFIALSVLGYALSHSSKVIFCIGALHIALADGLAAVVGVRFGKTSEYKIMGYTKSIAGTATFLVTSLLIMLGLFIFKDGSVHVPIAALLVIPVFTTIVENVGVYGIDNALVAIAIVAMCSLFGIS